MCSNPPKIETFLENRKVFKKKTVLKKQCYNSTKEMCKKIKTAKNKDHKENNKRIELEKI